MAPHALAGVAAGRGICQMTWRCSMEDSDLVPPGLGCPVCHERRMDYLLWTDDEWITCSNCGITFDADTWAQNEGGEDEST
jgi:hypothetical protein